MNRRVWLKLTAGAVATAMCGVGWRAWTNGLIDGDDRSFELWRSWSSLDGTRLLVAAAVLAANPHNSQPWRFRVDESTVEVYRDLTRALGPVDPFSRQMWIGVGCAIENVVVAARGRGLGLTLDPPGEAAWVARARIVGVAAPERRHLDAIARRHTNRGAFHRDRPLERAVLDALRSQVSNEVTRLVVHAWDSPHGRTFTDGIATSTARLIEDAQFMEATDRWFRLTPRELMSHRDGPSLLTSGLGRLTRWLAVLAPRPSAKRSHDEWLRSTVERHLGTAPSFGILCVRDASTPSQLIAAGRLWQRLHLEATALGLGAQPLDQMLELADRARQIGRADDTEARLRGLVDPGWLPVLMFRIGWPKQPAPASARRPLSEFVSGVSS